MRWNIWSNRRQGERRSDPDDVGGRRKAQRREGNRRNFVRLYYPPTAAPKVLNANFRILDLSENGIKFLCRNNCEECTDPISLKSILNLKIQFHDGEIAEVVIKISRCEAIPNGKDKTYAGTLTKGIAAERINKEETYLLNRSPQSEWEGE
ncbi:MAG: hypothetical protein P8Z79_17475 [Sedimentisphaerales bacterium]|jgi:hypothetical protein